jgi:hypothetical protein
MGAPGEGPRWLRAKVSDAKTGKVKVNVNIPIGLVTVGLNVAAGELVSGDQTFQAGASYPSPPGSMATSGEHRGGINPPSSPSPMPPSSILHSIFYILYSTFSFRQPPRDRNTRPVTDLLKKPRGLLDILVSPTRQVDNNYFILR